MTPPAGPGIASGDRRSPLFLRAPPLGPRRDTGSPPAPPRPSTTAPCLPPGRAGPGAASSSGPLTRASSVARRSHPLALWVTWALPVPPASLLGVLGVFGGWPSLPPHSLAFLASLAVGHPSRLTPWRSWRLWRLAIPPAPIPWRPWRLGGSRSILSASVPEARAPLVAGSRSILSASVTKARAPLVAGGGWEEGLSSPSPLRRPQRVARGQRR